MGMFEGQSRPDGKDRRPRRPRPRREARPRGGGRRGRPSRGPRQRRTQRGPGPEGPTRNRGNLQVRQPAAQVGLLGGHHQQLPGGEDPHQVQQGAVRRGRPLQPEDGQVPLRVPGDLLLLLRHHAGQQAPGHRPGAQRGVPHQDLRRQHGEPRRGVRGHRDVPEPGGRGLAGDLLPGPERAVRRPRLGRQPVLRLPALRRRRLLRRAGRGLLITHESHWF